MRHHKLFWGSSYDRGLDVLLYMWPDIKKEYPNAELHITYGWDLFDTITAGNPERAEWKKNVVRLMNQDGVVHHGRVGKKELAKIRKDCGIWAYPTYFTEINCITALECQHDGVVPVVINLAALKETVGSGVKVEGNIKKPEVQQEYLKQLLSLMGDKKRWKHEAVKGKKFANKYYWDNIAPKWIDEFKKPLTQPFVTVVTNTIRTGWWNIMAANLSEQTYKNFEWLIVDDYEKDRTEIAKKYAKKYGLNIRYVRGDKVLGKYSRRYGLVRANNKSWKEAKGELLVYLQDFILIPANGVEGLVDIYRHHPNALIAPVDDYWHCVKPNLNNKEDWWDGKLEIIDKHSWRNIRVQFAGLRKTDNAFDFEMNYSAIPKHIVESLNGWWEFFDDGLGYDNTDIALRAISSGYYILIDDTNIATCINLWPHIGGTKENITERERNLGMPYWLWLDEKLRSGDMPMVRDEKIDENINFDFKVPDEISDKDSADWITKHAEEIVRGWKDAVQE